MVQYQQQHQQQPRYNQPRSQMQHFNNRPPFTERRPLYNSNHTSTIYKQSKQDSSSIISLIQVQDQDRDHGEDSDDENKTKDLDIYAVKRRQTDESSLEKLRKKKGKEKATEPQDRLQYWNSLPDPSQFTRESNIRSNPVPNPQPLPGPSNLYPNYGTHMSKFATNNNSSPQPNTQKNKKPRKRNPKAKIYVDVPERSTWDIMKDSTVTLTVAEYLKMNKIAAREVKNGLTTMHGRKPRMKPTNKDVNMADPVVINTLRSVGLLNEEEYQRQKRGKSVKINSTNISDEEQSEWSSEEEQSWSNESEAFSTDNETDDDDSLIDYPYDVSKMKKAQPSRVYITINNQLVEAILDTGAAVSVISKSLVDKLGITGEIRGKIPISGYGESKSIPCKVITNVDVRIGGRLRREHFCVDESQDSKDVCLLGRTWIKTHDIGLRDKGKVAIVPIRNGTDYIEVACLPDNDESSVTTDQETVPVYQIRIFHNNISKEKNESAVATNQYSKEISTYQEDVISEEYQENEARNLTGGDDEDANGPIKNLVDQYTHCFVENVGLGRISEEAKKKQKQRYDKTVHFQKRYQIGEQVLMKDHYPPDKFSDRWIGPMTVVKVNESGTYHLVGPNKRRLGGAVNGDFLIPYHCKNRMVPDVTKKRSEELFNAWIERKSGRIPEVEF
ncbi:hypothetical protein G6F57_012407 [Rhizopus arrhizus]|nr:hypothetical protein G6F23_010655 [Rhizopus arrhizus]KAG1412174.1 hypothetical protein G6F58_008162 [Rhizopus delemar]KAG0928766.1 hypothetical protein G6F30_012255 [Rhizopus arrhizus]KAG0932218.1 hypothetical protein G6F32_011447 [Rhizopus arrhizus]KAG0974209.1 hypothetical protein G6F29_012355 [Rhizopus arrhizus]